MLRENGSLIDQDEANLRHVVEVLTKSREKRDKEKRHDAHLLLPLLKELKFFKERKPMTDE